VRRRAGPGGLEPPILLNPDAPKNVLESPPMIQSATSTSNPLPLVALVLGILGAIHDWRYKRKGGKKPSRMAKILFRVGLALIVILFVTVLALALTHEATAEQVAESGMSAVTGIALLLFVVWEIGRWIARHNNPLSKAPPAA